ncbi:hypothetical protein P7C70_g7265, partial [Phenoliferia sp. Uapishka_3]
MEPDEMDVLPDEWSDAEETATWAVLEDEEVTLLASEAADIEVTSVPSLGIIPPRTRRPLPAGTEETDQRDYFDELVIEITRPTEFEDYREETAVDTFLLAIIPTGSLSRRSNVDMLLSTKEPTAWPSKRSPGLHQDDIVKLEGLLYPAWLEAGVRSIQSPSKPDVRWPLWVLDFWRDQARVKKGKDIWRDAISYLGDEIQKAERKVEWHVKRAEPGEVGKHRERVATFTLTLARVHHIGWSSVVSNDTAYDTLQLAALLGEKWTRGYHLDSAFTLLRRRVPLASLSYEARLEDTLFSRELLKHLKGDHSVFPPRCKGLEAAGRWLKAGRETGVDRRLFALGHINGNHWISITIWSTGEVKYGDSLEVGAHVRGSQWWRTNGSAYETFARLAGLREDASAYPLRRMTVAAQNNSWDCGICAVNAVAHALFDDELWTTARSADFRVRMFLEGVDMDADPEALEASDADSDSGGSEHDSAHVRSTQALEEDVTMTDAFAQSPAQDNVPPVLPTVQSPITVPPPEKVVAQSTSTAPVPAKLAIHSFFTRTKLPSPPLQSGSLPNSKKRKTRDNAGEAEEGRIDSAEEPMDDPATRRSAWSSVPRAHFSLGHKAAEYQKLLEDGVLKSFDDHGFVCLCTPTKRIVVTNYARQPLVTHQSRQRHKEWIASRASSRMLISRVTSVPTPAPRARPRATAIIASPTAATCNSITLSRNPKTEAYLLTSEPRPAAACLGLHGKKYAPLFTSLTDFGGLGANYHLVYGKKAFRYKAWDGRPKSKWEASTKNYERLPKVPSHGNREVLISKWTTDERRKYSREAKRDAVWYLERAAETVRSGECTLSMTGPRKSKEGVCDACKALLKNKTFKRTKKERTKAVNQLAKLDEDDRQDKAYKKQTFTPGFRVSEHKALLSKYQHLPAIAELSQTLELESDSRLAPFIKLQAFAARGLLKGKAVMVGLIECLVQKVEIEQSDDPEKQKHAMNYVQDIMDFSILLRARGGTSAVQYEIIRSQLPLPHPRTVKRKTAKSGLGFAISGTDVLRIERYWAGITALNLHHHPVVLMQDCTQANQALTHTRNFSDLNPNGHIVGSILDLKDVAIIDEKSPAAITAAVQEQKAIATQVRAVLVKLPLDGDPGLVIHLSPTNGTSTGEAIFELTDAIRRQLAALGAKVVASAADGAATELRAQDLMVLNHAGGDFVVYDNDKYDLHLRAPIYPDSGPAVACQDAGHAKKTARNNLVGGATFLALGRCFAGFTNLLAALKSGISGLISTDVLKTDKQDDAAARRTMLPQVLQSCLNADGTIIPEQRGLFGYLLILGEIFDAWFNRTMRIEERLKLCFRGLHFLRNWKKDVERLSKLYPGLYSTTRGFLSTGANRILLRQCESLILLIISYRDFYPDTPFCPWQISSAPLEHWFGLCRQLEREFSIGSLFEMVKNVDLRHHILSSGRFAGKKERSGRRGYDHQVDSDPLTAADLEAHRTFPSKSTMDRIADEAWDEMATLSDWLGIPVPYLPLTSSAEPFVPFRPDGRDESDRLDASEDPDSDGETPEDDENPAEEETAEPEDEDEVVVPYDYSLCSNDPKSSSLSDPDDFGPAVAAATEEMIQRAAFREKLELDEEECRQEEAELEPEAPLPAVLTSARHNTPTLPQVRHAPTPTNSFSFSHTNKNLDVSMVITHRRLHVAGTNVQKERQKGQESLLPDSGARTLAGLVPPKMISNALRVAQEETPWNAGSRVASRLVRWTGTAKAIKAAALTQFGTALGPFSSQLLDVRGVTDETPLVAGSWMCCRNPGSTSHAPFWFIAQNIASFTKTDKAGKYSHAEKIVVAETLASMHVRAYKQMPSSGDEVDLDDDVFRHEIKRRPLPLNEPKAGKLPPGRDSLLVYVPGADFVYKFAGECFLPGDGNARQLNPESAKLWKAFNSINVANAFVHAIVVDEETRAAQRKEKAILAKKAKSEALRVLDKDGKAGQRLMEKKRVSALKKAEKAAALREDEEEVKKPEQKEKAPAKKATKGAVAKKTPKLKDAWAGDWFGKGKE